MWSHSGYRILNLVYARCTSVEFFTETAWPVNTLCFSMTLDVWWNSSFSILSLSCGLTLNMSCTVGGTIWCFCATLLMKRVLCLIWTGTRWCFWSSGILALDLLMARYFSSRSFLGGLSLHLNHLIAERVSAPYWQFGTLPTGIFLSNLVSGQLETSLMTSYCHFWNLSTFGDSRAVWVFWPKLGVFRKSKFSRWRSDGASMRLGGFR